MAKNINTSRMKRENRVRKHVLSSSDRPRLTVVRSNSNIFAQIIDQEGKVIVALGSLALKLKGTKTEAATKVGEKIAEMAKAKNVETVVFDRGNYRYHGRVKALAEAVRQSGIKF